MAHLARRHDAPLQGILAITFTTKAAREVRERLEVLLGPEAAAQPFIGTFHAFALATLRRWAPQLQAATGVRPGFSITEPGAAEALVARLLDRGLAGEAREGVAAALARERGLADARRLLRRISRMKNTVPDWAARGGPASMALAWARWRGAELTGAERAAAARDGAWAEAYAAALLESGALDFDDLLALALRLLRADAAVLARVRARFRHVLVDEFQDTNAVQYDLVRLLVNGPRDRDLTPNDGAQGPPPSPPPTLFIVGDPAQAIYGWRGAEPEALARRAAADFAPLRTLHLLDNYRSTRAIVEASHRVLGRAAGPALRALGPPGARVGVHRVRDAAAEAAAIARVIRRQLLGAGVPPDEIAVLLRVNRQAAAVEAALVRAGVPYRLVGRTRLWERREVQDVVAYLRLALRPGDDLAARRVLNVPARGIGKRTLERLEAAGGGSVARALFPETDGVEAVDGGDDTFPMPALPPSIAPRFVERLRGFRDTVLGLRALASSAEPRSISQLFAATLDITGYGKALEEEGAEGLGRLRNLQLLAAAADGWVSEGRAGGMGMHFEDDDDDNERGGESFDEAGSFSSASTAAQTPITPPQPTSTTNYSSLDTLQAFLDWCAIASSGDEAANGAGGKLVTVMTMHMAKGLEFEAVLIPGCVEGVLPQLARDPDTPGSLEEEARLAYVAMTRAKHHLHLFVPQIVPGHQAFGNRGVAKPSRFVQALERRVPHLLSHHTHDDLARR